MLKERVTIVLLAGCFWGCSRASEFRPASASVYPPLPPVAPVCADDSECKLGEFCDHRSCRTRPCSTDGKFGSVSPVFSSDVTASGFALSQDGLTAYVSHKKSSQYDIYVATRS